MYRLIVDTSAYAGNFERAAVAFATGLVGDCGVGEEEAAAARAELSQEDLTFWADQVIPVDDEGCSRPVEIWPTPGWYNHGLGEHFPDTPEGRQAGLLAYRAAVRREAERTLAVYRHRSPETLAPIETDNEAKIRKADALTEVSRYPAYQSIAVQLSVRPSPEQMARFVHRVRERLATPRRPWEAVVEVTGARLEEAHAQAEVVWRSATT